MLRISYITVHQTFRLYLFYMYILSYDSSMCGIFKFIQIDVQTKEDTSYYFFFSWN